MKILTDSQFKDIQARVDKLNAALQAANSALVKAQDKAYLASIEREGRENVFTFVRNGNISQIRTMGLLSDDLPAWKEELLR